MFKVEFNSYSKRWHVLEVFDNAREATRASFVKKDEAEQEKRRLEGLTAQKRHWDFHHRY